MKGISVAEKERRKVLSKEADRKKLQTYEIYNLAGKDKLEYDIATTERYITSCKYDLSKFKENKLIEYKLDILNKTLLNLKNELKKYG